jgi:hypothetical protein
VVDFRLSAYAAADTVLDTELNSIANNANTAASPAIDNSTDRYPFADLEFVIDHGTSPSVGGVWDIFILTRVDGSNFPTLDNVTAEPWYTLPVAANTNVQRITRQARLPIPPEQFQIFMRNRSGQSAVASGNTLKIRRYGIESV